MSFPLKIILPPSALTNPNIRFNNVVLPHPDGPSMETISPSFICKFMSFKIVTPSYAF